jgi:hypothetical protein
LSADEAEKFDEEAARIVQIGVHEIYQTISRRGLVENVAIRRTRENA